MSDENSQNGGLGKSLVIGFLIFVAIIAVVSVCVMVFGDSGEIDHIYEGFD